MVLSQRGCARVFQALLVAQCVAMSACSKNEASVPAEKQDAAGVVHPDIWPQVPRPAIDDSPHEARLAALLKSLSVEEKVGQIVQADVADVTPEDVRQYRDRKSVV